MPRSSWQGRTVYKRPGVSVRTMSLFYLKHGCVCRQSDISAKHRPSTAEVNPVDPQQGIRICNPDGRVEVVIVHDWSVMWIVVQTLATWSVDLTMGTQDERTAAFSACRSLLVNLLRMSAVSMPARFS